MIIERTYHPSELHHGVCSYCGEESSEITESGLCADCVEAEVVLSTNDEGHMISHSTYDAWKVSPPCNHDKECHRGCPYFNECWGEDIEEQ